MKILVACEFSGIVRDAFIAKGHDAVSCDLLPSESDRGKHYQCDVLELIGLTNFDMMIAHPPCTYLAVCGNASFRNNPERWSQRLEAMLFVHNLLNVSIEKICLENPVGVISTHIRPPEQYIQPYEHGHMATKKTGLWLKNLTPLKPTNIVGKGEVKVYPSGNKSAMWHAKTGSGSGKLRSLTYQGIADAMADQWG